MNSMERRKFLGMSLALAASPKANEPERKFPTDPRGRLAVSTYPFRRLIATPHAQEDEPATAGMTLEQFAPSIVSKLKVPGIEPWSHHFNSTNPVYVRGLRAAFEDAGVRVVNIPVDLRARLCGSATKLSQHTTNG